MLTKECYSKDVLQAVHVSLIQSVTDVNIFNLQICDAPATSKDVIHHFDRPEHQHLYFLRQEPRLRLAHA